MKVKIDSMLTISNATQKQIDKIIQDNTYKNPEFQNAINMNRSTYKIDKEIKTYTLEDNIIIIPRGYLHELPEHELLDNTITAPVAFSSLDGIVLRGYQDKAVKSATQHNQGITQAGTGSGKTYIGIDTIRQQGQKTLILTHSKELVIQWQVEIKKVLGLECGIIGGGKNIQADVTICMLQTLNKRPELLQELSNNYGLVLIDECHHIPSKTFAKVINQLACKYRYGLTATPHRRDGLHQLINRHIGAIVAVVPDSEVKKVNGVVPITIKQIDTNRSYYAQSWNEYIALLTDDNIRNIMIADMAVKASLSMPVLILTDRVEHAERLSEMVGIKHLLIHGQLPAKIRKERMIAIPEHNLTIGTTGLLGEGLDVSGWTALILATPISSKVKLLQAVGRVCRTHKNKIMGYVADLVDDCGFSVSSYRKRQAIYQEKGFNLIENESY